MIFGYSYHPIGLHDCVMNIVSCPGTPKRLILYLIVSWLGPPTLHSIIITHWVINRPTGLGHPPVYFVYRHQNFQPPVAPVRQRLPIPQPMGVCRSRNCNGCYIHVLGTAMGVCRSRNYTHIYTNIHIYIYTHQANQMPHPPSPTPCWGGGGPGGGGGGGGPWPGGV